MVMRLIVIGAAICLLAAFLGRRRLALWLLLALSIAALALWGYESYQLRSQGQLFDANDIVISDVAITPSNYRPNLFELTGRIQNNSEQTTLDGVLLGLTLSDCNAADECTALPPREQFVATKLAPQTQTQFLEKIYLDKSHLPQGEVRVEFEMRAQRGHRPVW